MVDPIPWKPNPKARTAIIDWKFPSGFQTESFGIPKFENTEMCLDFRSGWELDGAFLGQFSRPRWGFKLWRWGSKEEDRGMVNVVKISSAVHSFSFTPRLHVVKISDASAICSDAHWSLMWLMSSSISLFSNTTRFFPSSPCPSLTADAQDFNSFKRVKLNQNRT